MFTWICPTCGREVPPSYDDCPDCAAKAKAGAEDPSSAPDAPPPLSAPLPAPAIPAHFGAPPSSRAALPTWLLAVLFAVVLVCLGGAFIWWMHRSGSTPGASAAAPVQSAPPALPAGAKESVMQKYIEVSGIRLQEAAKGATEARFLVINHSGADITDLGGMVNIWGRAGKTEEAAGSFNFKLPSIGPYESKEAVAPVNTKLKVYELPDWQFITTQVQITSP
ncbi:MAG: hypothetical protein ABSH50_15475 [Bryobacteraceae bacterium]|jgi:hypothetical protein